MCSNCNKDINTFCLLIINIYRRRISNSLFLLANFKLRNFITFISKRAYNFLLRNFHLEITIDTIIIQISSHDPLMDIITAYRLSILLTYRRYIQSIYPNICRSTFIGYLLASVSRGRVSMDQWDIGTI